VPHSKVVSPTRVIEPDIFDEFSLLLYWKYISEAGYGVYSDLNLIE
jgi:hypothetical protein